MQGITEDELVEDIDEICFGQGLSIVTETINAEDVSVAANVHGIAVKDVYSVWVGGRRSTPPFIMTTLFFRCTGCSDFRA